MTTVAAAANYEGWLFIFYYVVFALCCALISLALGINKGRQWDAFFIGLLLTVIGIVVVVAMRPTPEAQRKIDADKAKRGVAPSRPPMQSPAGWHPDPYGVHELRYFDGTSWREMVSDAGVQSVDAPPPS